MKICFAASSGGHFEQLMMLKPLMEKYDSFIITEKTDYEVTAAIKIYYVDQINRKELLFGVKLIWNILISLRIFFKVKSRYCDMYRSFGNASNLQDLQIV